MGSAVNNKKMHIEFIRTLAICLVLFNHTEAKGYTLYTLEQGTLMHWVYLCFAIFVKIAVPLFFMISGALLLGKEESIKEIFLKRIVKIVIVLFATHFAQYIFFLGRQIQMFSFEDFFARIYAGKGVLALWYLYAYLAFLLMLPFLRKLAKSMKNQEFKYMIFVFLFVQIVYILEYCLWHGELEHNENFSMFIVSTTVFYPLLGYYLENLLSNVNQIDRIVKYFVILSIVCIVITAFLTQHRCQIIGKWEENSSQKFFECFIFIPAMTIYLMCKRFFEKHRINRIFEKIVWISGSCSFGVYLFENIYRIYTEKIFYILEAYLPTFVSCCIWIGCAFALGVAITYCLKKIPFVCKFL